MKISESGGEFELIKRVGSSIPAPGDDVIVGIGDDAAVIKTGNPNEYLLVTTDTLVAGQHFQIDWSSALDIGIKASECNVSDIAAMGGKPTFMFVSLVLRDETPVEWVEELYRGLVESCQRNGVSILGGDTTQGPVEVISITLLGKVASENLCLRSHAQVGDLLAVTGSLGASAAGLHLKQNGFTVPSYLREKHVAPRCRLAVAQKIAPSIHAMIDISDGLASEVNHICDLSRTGALVYAAKIPLHDDVIQAAESFGKSPLDFALYGGEDFELLFSIRPENLSQLDNLGVQYFVVGEVIHREEGRFLIESNGGKIPLEYSSHHFKE